MTSRINSSYSYYSKSLIHLSSDNKPSVLVLLENFNQILFHLNYTFYLIFYKFFFILYSIEIYSI